MSRQTVAEAVRDRMQEVQGKEQEIPENEQHKFHVGPLVSMDLADQIGNDFVAYCGTIILGTKSGGDWLQRESNVPCVICAKGVLSDALDLPYKYIFLTAQELLQEQMNERKRDLGY
jgi:hypothetical protein